MSLAGTSLLTLGGKSFNLLASLIIFDVFIVWVCVGGGGGGGGTIVHFAVLIMVSNLEIN